MIDEVVITGSGLISSLGMNAGETWRALMSGKSGIGPIKGFEAGGFECRLAAQVPVLDPEALGIHPKAARIMDKHALMLSKCAREAFSAAKLDRANISGEETGVFLGMGMVDYKVEDLLPAVLKSMDSGGELDYQRFYAAGFREIYPLWPLSILNNIALSQVAIDLNIRGENAVFTPHADAGILAVAEAAKAVAACHAKAVLAGGMSEKISALSLARAHFSGTLNISNIAREHPCRPFSPHARGTVLGEGGAIVVLESRSAAVRRGIPFHATISGDGFACGIDSGYSAPSVNAVVSAMTKAIRNAGIEPSDIDVIIAHGDGYPTGDKNESDAICRVFEKNMDRIHIFSSKGALGHMYAGAAPVDVVLAAYMIEKDMVPPTRAYDAEGFIGSLNIVHGGPTRKPVKRVLINAGSHQGSVGSLVLEKCAYR